MIRISPVCIFLAALFIIILSCTSLIPEKESWEGIDNNTLRVFVHYEYPDDLDGRINPAAKGLLQDSGRSRAEIVLLSYIRIHVTGIDRVIACQQTIPGIVAKGTIRHFTCDAQQCTAYIDFDVMDFLKAAGIHEPH